ncbi:MAG: tripartite tricarboxylate transporter substrate binding protein [Oxalobacteraceae bacterium]|nr:MAG: tripartite tricarboxylate transporter substrate binding protein [Oxalobacteraceae bacterium]
MSRCMSFVFIAGLLLAAPGQLAAQPYPNKPIKLIVPYTAGGSTDATARVVGEAMSEILGQPVVIENKPGATATLGIDIVSKSKPDGYTLGVSGVAATAIIPLIDPKLTYSPLRDLDMIAGLISVDSVLIARPALKQNTMAEVLEFARANPEKVTFATAGVAGPAHLNLEYLQHLAKAKMLHVPFNGDSPAITAVLSGDVDIASVALAGAVPFLVDGKLKLLAANGPGKKRIKILPNVSAVQEQTGFENYNPHTWSVLVTAKGTPPEIIEKLNKAVNQALARPEIQQKLENYGLTPLTGDVKWTQELVTKEISEKKQIIELVGLKRE